MLELSLEFETFAPTRKVSPGRGTPSSTRRQPLASMLAPGV